MQSIIIQLLIILTAALHAHQSAAFSTSVRNANVPHSTTPFMSLQSNEHETATHGMISALKQSTAMAPLFLSAFAFAAVPHTANAGDITKGSEVFTANCIGCHRGGQNFVKEQKTLQKDALEKYVGLDEVKVTKFFKGSFVHKVVGGKLTEDEVGDVVSYVVDQAKGEKW